MSDFNLRMDAREFYWYLSWSLKHVDDDPRRAYVRGRINAIEQAHRSQEFVLD